MGDDTPVTAVSDHVRALDPDHIVLALRSPEHADWQERGLIERIESEVGVPLPYSRSMPTGRHDHGSRPQAFHASLESPRRLVPQAAHRPIGPPYLGETPATSEIIRDEEIDAWSTFA